MTALEEAGVPLLVPVFVKVDSMAQIAVEVSYNGMDVSGCYTEANFMPLGGVIRFANCIKMNYKCTCV